MPSHPLVLILEREKETKNRIRYTPAGELAVGSLYLTKAAAAEIGTPARLTVTLAAEEKAPLTSAA